MNKKHGFTVSELLMSIAIVAIVSAMGMTIAKRGTDDAYKNYFAIGTMNLNNALSQIETGDVNVGPNAARTQLIDRTEYVTDANGNAVMDNNNLPITRKMAANPLADIFQIDNLGHAIQESRYPHFEDPQQPNNPTYDNNDFRGPMWITNNLKYLFGDTNIKQNNICNPNSQLAADHCVINADNGITYEITDIVPRNGVGTFDIIEFEMTVPAPRRRDNGNIVDRAKTSFIYARNLNEARDVNNNDNPVLRDSNNNLVLGLGNSQMLIPSDNNPNPNDGIPFVNMQDRQDLLLAYIDDGVVGRHKQDSVLGIETFMPIRYGTFRDALSTILNPNSFNMVNDIRINDASGNARVVVRSTQFQDNNGVQQPAARHLARDNANRPIQNIDAQNRILGTAPSSGVIKFASPRKLK